MKICKCVECNSAVPLSSTSPVEGKRYCIDCYTKLFCADVLFCDRCHNLVSEKDIIIEGYEQICADCDDNR